MMRDTELADKIDCDLHRLAESAHVQADESNSPEWRELAMLIQAARAQSYRMLTPEHKRRLEPGVYWNGPSLVP